MVRIVLVVLGLIGVGSASGASGSDAPFFTPALDSLISVAVEKTINQEYDSALADVRSIEARFPESPVGPFFRAAVLHSMMIDYENYDEEPEFKRAVDLTLARSKKWLRRPETAAWGNFFMGAGLAYLAFYYGKQMQIVQAFRTGLSSISALERALAADSTLYDAYLGLGVYKYYRSKYARFLSWLPFVADEREEGIRMVYVATDKGKFSRYAATNTLIWLLLDEKRFDEAYRLAHNAAATYPNSRFFMWTAAATERYLGRWDAALQRYQAILDSFQKEGRLAPYNEVVIRARLAESYHHLGDWLESNTQCHRALAVPLTKAEKRRAQKYLRKLEELSELNQEHLRSTETGEPSEP